MTFVPLTFCIFYNIFVLLIYKCYIYEYYEIHLYCTFMRQKFVVIAFLHVVNDVVKQRRVVTLHTS